MSEESINFSDEEILKLDEHLTKSQNHLDAVWEIVTEHTNESDREIGQKTVSDIASLVEDNSVVLMNVLDEWLETDIPEEMLYDSNGDLGKLATAIMDVWGGYDDFDSTDYIAFVIEQNIEDLRDTRYWTEYENEMADIAICAIRALCECPNDQPPRDIIERRLAERMEGQQEVIIDSYKEDYHA